MFLISMQIGAPCVLETDILSCNIDEVLRQCEGAKQATGESRCACIGSPAFLERIVQHCVATGQEIPFSIGRLGGAPVYSRLTSLLHRHTKCCHIVYGSTEAEPISSISNAEKILREAGVRKTASHMAGHCVGKPHFPGGLAIIRQYDGELWQTYFTLCDPT